MLPKQSKGILKQWVSHSAGEKDVLAKGRKSLPGATKSESRSSSLTREFTRPKWQFVLAREESEGRRIRRDDFIGQYFSARENVNNLKKLFKKDIRVDLLLKNNDGTQRAYKANIERIDSHIPEKYSPADLETLLNDPHGAS
jgi:hypothetical protein